MKYLGAESLEYIFKTIATNYARREDVPSYSEEHDGIEKLLGVFQGVQMDAFYPTALDKVVYLFTQINKDHFFSNGNKRLALVCSVLFAKINGFLIKEIPKAEYEKKLKELFPSFDAVEDDSSFTAGSFALYNLSILVADSQKYVENNNFDILKSKVRTFFEYCLEEGNSH